MQDLLELEKKVLEVYEKMDIEAKALAVTSGLTCLSYCGACCANPEIEASPLELLPMALFFLKQNKAEEVLLEIKNIERNYCHFYHHEKNNFAKGSCKAYAFRPTICRLFGVAKVGERYSVCRIIKENNHSAYEKLVEKNPDMRSMQEWSMQLFALDPYLARERLPINHAMKKILEKVLLVSGFSSLE